jgi:hypothetical protein
MMCGEMKAYIRTRCYTSQKSEGVTSDEGITTHQDVTAGQGVTWAVAEKGE